MTDRVPGTAGVRRALRYSVSGSLWCRYNSIRYARMRRGRPERSDVAKGCCGKLSLPQDFRRTFTLKRAAGGRWPAPKLSPKPACRSIRPRPRRVLSRRWCWPRTRSRRRCPETKPRRSGLVRVGAPVSRSREPESVANLLDRFSQSGHRRLLPFALRRWRVLPGFVRQLG